MNAAPSRRPSRRVSVPTVLQLEAAECGAAALAMVLAYHGRIVPLSQLRLDCGVSRDGSKASNIVRAARKYGLQARGFRKDLDQLASTRPPAILHWNFNHFVVLEGWKDEGVYISDPASGRAVVSPSELDDAFTGVVLTFEPSAGFEKGGRARSFLRALQGRLEGATSAIVFVALAGLALILPALMASALHKVFIDDVAAGNLARWMRPLLLAMAATGLVIFAVSALQRRYLLRLENRLSASGSGQFFWHVLRLPVSFFHQRFPGDVAERVGIVDRVSSLLAGDLAGTAVSVVMALSYGALLFLYDAPLAVIGIAIAALQLVAVKLASRTRELMTQRLANDRGKLAGAAMGALQTIETLKASGTEARFLARRAGHEANLISAQQRLDLATLILSLTRPLMLSLNAALILGIGGLRILDGQLTIGLLLAFQTLLLSFLGPVNQILEFVTTAQEVKGDLVRLDDVMQAPVDSGFASDPPAPATAGAARLSGRIELRNVTFGYSRLDPPILENLALEVKPGSRVALVGGSGSGKSTIARLVAGLLEPWSGAVCFDGVPRKLLPRPILVESLAMVDQEISLFEGDLRANLTLWDTTIADADVQAAARDACIHDDIVARAGGYGAAVEEGGRNFSGGQRQRLELARALAINPTIVVLDEATSALDPATEQRVQDNLRARGCTCLIVAHRLSTIRDCDEILVLEAGRIVQRGDHEALVAIPGLYRDLILAEDP